MKRILLCFFLLSPLLGKAQFLMAEDFIGTIGNPIQTLGWDVDCSGPSITVASPGLIYAGYVGSGLGNSALITNNGPSTFSNYSYFFGGSSNPLYASFLINVQSAPANYAAGGGCSSGTNVIIAFSDGGANNDDGMILTDNGSGTFRIGLKVSGGLSFGAGSYTYNTTHLIVMKQLGSSIDLRIDPPLGGPEPVPDVTGAGGSGGAKNYLHIGNKTQTDLLVDGIRVSTNYDALVALSEPTNQPSSMIFSNLASSGYTVGFDVATGNPSGYLAIRRSGASPTGIPVDDTPYAVGATIGDGSVAYVGSASSFDETTLSAATIYHYDIFAYNESGSLINYLTTVPLEGSRSTLASEPTAQPTNLIFSSITSMSLTGQATPASPNPDSYIVLRKQASAPTAIPVDGIFPTIGGTIGDAKVVSINITTLFNESALSPGATYYYALFSFNGSGASVNYLTTSPLVGNTITVPAAPNATGVTNISQTGFTVNWDAVPGAADYSLDVGDGGLAIYLPGYNNRAVTGTSETISGLTPGQFSSYAYRLRANNASGTSANSNEVSFVIIPPDPVATSATLVSQSSFEANWNAAIGATSYELEVTDEVGNLLNGYPATFASINTTVSGLAPATAYKYKVKAINGAGVSGYSNEIIQTTIGYAPVAKTVTIQGPNSFAAEWEPVAGATGFELDVTLFNENFATFVGIYNAYSIAGNVTSELVQGLSPGGAYKFRVRAVGPGGVTSNSNVVGVLLEGGSGGGISVSNNNQSVSTTLGGTIEILSNVVGDVRGIPSVTFFHKKITDPDFIPEGLNFNTGLNAYKAMLEDADMDELGAEFFIEAIDEVNQISQTPVKKIYRVYDTKSNSPVFVSEIFDGSSSNFKIVAVPYKLQSDLVQSVFGELGAYDRTKWKLGHFQDGQVVEMAGTGNIERGQGYWFNAKGLVTVKTGATHAPPDDQNTPFKLTFKQGWNQIGNPYPFVINWDEVKNSNPTITGLGSPNFFLNGSYQIKNSFEVFEGAFVFADKESVVDFPVGLKNISGGRKKSNAIGSDLDADKWLVKLSVRQGKLQNKLPGFGMHPLAKASKDEFDEMTLPRFNDFLELNFDHPEYFYPSFSRDIVTTNDKYTWSFKMLTNLNQQEARLEWDHQSLRHSLAQLFLLDEATGHFVNMKEIGSYKFYNTPKNSFRIYYERDPNKILVPDVLVVGELYPNPVLERVNIPLILPPRVDSYSLEISIYDYKGKKISSVVKRALHAGIHTMQWDVRDRVGARIPSGIYLCKIQLDQMVVVKKIMIPK